LIPGGYDVIGVIKAHLGDAKALYGVAGNRHGFEFAHSAYDNLRGPVGCGTCELRVLMVSAVKYDASPQQRKAKDINREYFADPWKS